MKSTLKHLSLDASANDQVAPYTTFEQEINAYLKDSNAYGNIYFARYFEWQGICRETWFSQQIFPNMFELEGAFVTKYAHNDYEQEVFPFQKLKCLLNTRHVKKASFEIVFRFYCARTQRLVSQGSQKVAYMSTNGKRLMPLPADILQKIRQYELH